MYQAFRSVIASQSCSKGDTTIDACVGASVGAAAGGAGDLLETEKSPRRFASSQASHASSSMMASQSWSKGLEIGSGGGVGGVGVGGGSGGGGAGAGGGDGGGLQQKQSTRPSCSYYSHTIWGASGCTCLFTQLTAAVVGQPFRAPRDACSRTRTILPDYP